MGVVWPGERSDGMFEQQGAVEVFERGRILTPSCAAS
jgi:hypothetical protein